MAVHGTTEEQAALQQRYVVLRRVIRALLQDLRQAETQLSSVCVASDAKYLRQWRKRAADLKDDIVTVEWELMAIEETQLRGAVMDLLHSPLPPAEADRTAPSAHLPDSGVAETVANTVGREGDAASREASQPAGDTRPDAEANTKSSASGLLPGRGPKQLPQAAARETAAPQTRAAVPKQPSGTTPPSHPGQARLGDSEEAHGSAFAEDQGMGAPQERVQLSAVQSPPTSSNSIRRDLRPAFSAIDSPVHSSPSAAVVSRILECSLLLSPGVTPIKRPDSGALQPQHGQRPPKNT
eukprot:GGOE01061402.1.p1 GENE.GGOE01061402.1~~GGOE01061402.1.p1  ORF type:complete len:296 (-),score=55.76 GGOE01061402.1:146-1033(-)